MITYGSTVVKIFEPGLSILIGPGYATASPLVMEDVKHVKDKQKWCARLGDFWC